MSLLKKVTKSRLGFQGQTPTSYTTQLFNNKVGNSTIIREVKSKGGSKSETPITYTLLVTENNEILLTEDNFELILE